ncbi:hypothetical protein M011DRAFT_469565 [Sporormia fimetaria CBS 119925]|uniref:Uncharacterized protein n=1 Tax=Sporormia fimetaria CBS 119925 TaxID=1340428 RepID=A0A6A6V736_9PLEO|nr:hypothetical protein M011DRAFT_469565 [Sporormia fimetaria CBS 119925]
MHYSRSVDYLNLEHVFVAQLADLPPLDNLSSLGFKVAVSKRAHRIAIASWKTVRVWSLDPMAFLDPEHGLRDPKTDAVPGDYAYTEGCGWQYYDCGSFERDCVVLEPVELPSQGVVLSLEFRGEDELWGVCDSGLVRWYFGANAQGRRDVKMLG